MKKFLTVLAIILTTALVSPVFAQPEVTPTRNREKLQKQRGERGQKGERTERKNRDRGERMDKEVSAEQMLTNIEERKTRVLENMAKRYTKLNERFAKFSERISKASSRMEKLRNEKTGSEKLSMGEEQLKERKEKVTARYQDFQKNIGQRKAQILERMEKVRTNALKRIEQLPETDRDKVKTALENSLSQIKVEAEKLEKEAREKIEATYQKFISI